MKELREQAIQVLSNIREEFLRYERCNKLIRGIEPDFPAQVHPMNGIISEKVVRLLDSILGDEIASYFLWEATTMKDGGRIFETDGTEWPIRAIDDVRAYVNREGK